MSLQNAAHQVSDCDKISKKYFFFYLHQHILNKINFYIPFNENFILYLLVSDPYVLIISYIAFIKNENYLFLRFYLPLLDRDVGGPFEFNLKFRLTL